MWISIGKCSQNIKIKRIPDENNNKVTKTHEYCSTNKATGRMFSKWCIIMLKSYSEIVTTMDLNQKQYNALLDTISWDTSPEKRLWCSSAPLPLPVLSFVNHVSMPSCKPTLKGKGKEEMSQQMYCVWECRPAPLWKLIWISEDNEPDE